MIIKSKVSQQRVEPNWAFPSWNIWYFSIFRDTNNVNSEFFYHFPFLNPIWKTIHRDFLPHSNQWNLIVSLFWCWMNVKMAHDAARLVFIPHVPASLRVTTATIHRNYSSFKIPTLCMSFFTMIYASKLTVVWKRFWELTHFQH